MEVLPDLIEKDIGITIRQCEILGPLGLIVQGILGVMSLSSLLIKRYMERPQRPWNIWFLDTSKQVFSAGLVHCLNMVLSTLLSESSVTDNCEWYFINFAVDVGIGTILCFVIIKSIEAFAAVNGIDALNTGVYVHEDYSHPENVNLEPTEQETGHIIDYRIWGLQLFVWTCVVLIVKISLFFTVKIFSPIFEDLADFCLGWLKQFPDLKLVFIMILIPITLNVIQFWIQDNILKGKKENILKFIHSPYHERCHTPQVPPKFLSRSSNLDRMSRKEERKLSISEYCT
ncbi:unnamed protein product [Moneuplotes crassus]|uniref:Vacuolar membrane protein n=1 Tax=Euplotes crassus TaxID=5936 RepID=A0AAD1XRD0_EUPCR|nr:unnamed protein product [Moneuplotes crassus]